ncbi:MAG: hypothetical protein WAL61_14980 [Acidimicrobiales bacterium]
MKKSHLLKLAVIGSAAVVLPVIGAGQAFADYAPQPNDIVGVGGDTPQYAVDLLINGDTSGHLGFDEATGVNRVAYFDANGDANGRQAYTSNVTTGVASTLLNPTVVLRAGDNPVQRPQSSGAALSALEADKPPTDPNSDTINFVASATAPAAGNGVPGGLDYVKFGTDTIQIAVSSASTNAPAGLSPLELANIYDGTWTTWGQVAAAGGPASGDTIYAEIPTSTSSIYSKFVAALVAVDPSFSVDAAFVHTVEQNDPSTITGAPIPADAIAPFSSARLNLWNDGYFFSPATVFPGASSPLSANVKLLSGTAADSSASLSVAITDYFVFRANDAALSGSTHPYEPGGTLNWVQTLFYNSAWTPGSTSVPAPWIDTSTGQALIAASGVTPIANPNATFTAVGS